MTAESSDLIALVEDALRFLQQNRELIEKAPLQIYCSVLLFSPQKSLIRRIYLPEVQYWIQNKPLVREEEWNTQIQVIGHHENCKGLDFSPDGSTLASVSCHEIKIWDASRGRCLRTITLPDGSYRSHETKKVALSVDGSVVAIIDEKKCVLWNAKTGRCFQTFQGDLAGKISSVAFSQDGHTLAMGLIGASSSIMLWNIETGVCFRTLCSHRLDVHELVFLDDHLLVSRHQNSINIWNTETGERPRQMETDFNLQRRPIMYEYEVHRIIPVSWRYKITSETAQVELWETFTELYMFVTEYALEKSSEELSIYPRNGMAMRIPKFRRRIELFDLKTSEMLKKMKTSGRILHQALSFDAKQLAIVSYEGVIGRLELSLHRYQQYERKSDRNTTQSRFSALLKALTSVYTFKTKGGHLRSGLWVSYH